MKRHFDPASQVVYAFVIGGIAGGFYLRTEDKRLLGLSLVFTVYALVQMVLVGLKAYQGRINTSRFRGQACLKCEDGCLVAPLEAGKAIDGLNTRLYPDEVYKVRSGSWVDVDERGEVYGSIGGWLLGNGWKDRSYFRDRGAELEWMPLFRCEDK